MNKARKVILTTAACVAGLALGLSVPAALATGADTTPTTDTATTTDPGTTTAPATTTDPVTTTAPTTTTDPAPVGNGNTTQGQTAQQIAQVIQSSTTNCSVSVTSDVGGDNATIINVTCLAINEASIAQSICQVQVQAPVANNAVIGCNVIGPQGPMGPQGNQGPQGIPGLPGANGAPGPETDVCLNWPRDGKHNNPTEIMKLTGIPVVFYQTNTGMACVTTSWIAKVKLAAKLKAKAHQKIIVKIVYKNKK